MPTTGAEPTLILRFAALAAAALALGAGPGPAGVGNAPPPTRAMAVNHTYTHPDLQRVPLEEYERDFLRGEPGIRELLAARGRAPRWFRHPLTHTGPTREVRSAFEAFLAEHGYAIAPFSIEAQSR